MPGVNKDRVGTGGRTEIPSSLIEDIENLKDSKKKVIDLGDIQADAIDEAFNDYAYDEYLEFGLPIEIPATGFVEVHAIQNDKKVVWLFTGASGSYDGNTTLAILSDFTRISFDGEVDLEAIRTALGDSPVLAGGNTEDTAKTLRDEIDTIKETSIIVEASDSTIYAEEKLLTFELKSDAYTSAGIFDGDKMIKRLWDNEFFPGGTNTRKIEYKDNYGNYLDGNYQVKILSTLIQPEWLGVIANTSDLKNHPEQKLSGLEQPKWFHSDGNRMYYSVGYNEGEASIKYFNLDEIENGMVRRKHDTYGDPMFAYGLCTDAENLYLAGYASYGSNTGSMIFAINKTNFDFLNFSAGISRNYSLGGTHDVMEGDEYSTSGNSGLNQIEGITVQQSGNYVFASRPSNNTIVVNNKTTGELVRTISNITSPKWVWLENDNVMWLIHDDNVIEKYTVNGDGTLTSLGITINSTTAPIYLRTDNGKLLVTDSADNKVKEFNTSDGSATSVVIGRTETYAQDATVYDDKFVINEGSAVYDNNGNIWVVDDGNYRWLKFTSVGDYDDVFGMQLPRTYGVEVDENDKSKIYTNGLVYQITDWNNPTENWSLIFNYTKKLNLEQYYSIRTPVTVDNRTYALIRENGESRIYLIAPENVEYTGIFSTQIRASLDKDLNLLIDKSGSPLSAYRLPFQSFDVNNFPVYGPEEIIATLNSRKLIDPNNAGTTQSKLSWRETSDGKIWQFNTTPDQNFKLGGLKKEIGTDWSVLALPPTFLNYTGEYTENGFFDIGNGTNFPGGSIYTAEEFVLANHKGEFWKNGQTNMLFLYHQSGLLIRQFGIVRDDLPFGMQMAGNVFSTRGHIVSGNLFWFQNDESYNGGIGVWKIPDVYNFEIQTIDVQPTVNNGKIFIKPFNESILDTLNASEKLLVSDGLNVDFSQLPDNFDKTKLSYVIEKFNVKLDYNEIYTFYFTTNCGIRVSDKDNVLRINEYDNDQLNTFSFSLGQLDYELGNVELSIELSGQKGTTLLCEYESANETRKQIPSEKISSFRPVTDKKINLLKNLKRLDYVEEMYGWELSPKNTNNLSNLYLISGQNSLNAEDVFFYYNVLPDVPVASVIRKIGRKANEFWQLDLSFNEGSTTGYIEAANDVSFFISDASGNKIIEIKKIQTPRVIEINGVQFPDINSSTTKFNRVKLNVSKNGIRILGVDGITYGYAQFDDNLNFFDQNANWKDIYSLKIEMNVFNPNSGLKYGKRVQIKKAIVTIN